MWIDRIYHLNEKIFQFLADWMAGRDEATGQNLEIPYVNKSLENFDTLFLMEKLHFLNFL